MRPLRQLLNDSLLPLTPHLSTLPPALLSILHTAHDLLSDQYFSSLASFLEVFNRFYLELASRFETLIKYRQLVMTKVRRRVVERATISILEDLERVTQEDRDSYWLTRKELMDQVITRDPDYIQYGRVDIDRVIEEQRQLTRTLHRRDEMWFSHFRD